MILQLSSKQKAAIKAGELKRNRLIRATQQAANQVNSNEKPIHYYIYGPSGIGKTYQSMKAIKESGVDYISVSGNISMYNFVLKLAIIGYENRNNKVVVVIDDCDEILKDAKTINQMKELLGEESKISYNKRLHLNQLGDEDSIPYRAVEYWMNSNGVGFTVDCSNMTFIITSNIRLPYDSTAGEIEEKNGGLPTARSTKARHLAPIRGRCETKDLDMTMEEKWGNLASVCLEDGACQDCNNEQEKIFILDYIWNNWDNMKETSIRTAEKMARTLKLEGADGIKDAFDADYLK
tara:strand:+ start:2630 stop:3508 length:879 start_codon:yes stop_codon:yes gene_type:complete